MTEMTLLINEVFGPTIQGEGPAAGQRCAFVRLAICPLRCRWCDTSYTWAFTDALAARHQSHTKYSYEDEVHELTVGEIVAHTLAILEGANLVVLSGGEPLAQVPPALQRPGTGSVNLGDPVGELVYRLGQNGVRTHIETAGIRMPSAFLHSAVERYVVSPKLATSGNTLATRRNIHVLDWFANTKKADFKFVVTEPEDFSEIAGLANVCNIPAHRIWVMPEGTTPQAILDKQRMVAERGIAAGYNVSSRLHILAWGDERKR